jgi:hypothetical protein
VTEKETDWSGCNLIATHAQLLTEKAITPAVARAQGIYSITTVDQLPEAHAVWGEQAVPALAFPWSTPSGEQFVQLRPDTPIEVQGEKRARKYLWPAGTSSAIAEVRRDESDLVFFVEGTKQALAAAGYLEEGSVYGIAGCRSWSTEGVPVADLDVVEDKRVVLIFDADISTNLDVWTAAEKFTEALRAEGAVSVAYVLLPAGKTAGLDDVLGSKEEGKRARYLERLVELAKPRLGGSGGIAKPKRDTQPAGPVLPTGDRPIIMVNDDRLDVISGVVGALRNRWDGTELFCYGGALARRAGATMTPVTKDAFSGLVSQAAVTGTVDTRGNFTYAWPDAVSMGAALVQAERFTPLDRVTEVPFVRADGTICQVAGYDVATRTFLADAVSTVSVPADPTEGEISQAVKLLTVEWLGDLFDAMPSDADRANALALILTPLIRGLVPLVPLAVVNGLQMGVGKNLFGDLVALLSTGRESEPLPWTGNEEETRKQITSVFRGGSTLAVFDEAHTIEGAALARAITAVTYKDRKLGVSDMIEFPNTMTWVSLGNQVQVNGDMSRRVYVVRIAPKVANPQDRSAESFRHPEIREWTRDHRSELLSAALTLVRAWFAAGCPRDGAGALAGRRLGSFEKWGGLVGGVLDVAGVPGFLGNLQQYRSESDFDRVYWTAHLRWLRSVFGAREFTTGDVIAKMRSRSDVEHPPGRDLTDHTAPGYGRALGQAYGRQKDKMLDDVQLVLAVESKGHGNRWRVASPEGGKGQEGGPAGGKSSKTAGLGETADTPHPVRVDRVDRVVANTLYAHKESPIGDGARARVYLGPGQISLQPDQPDQPGSPIDHLAHLVATPVPLECPDCDAVLELVPPALFWYACRHCTPGTFTRA